MENKDIVEMLDAITNYINKEEYQKALNYIKGKKSRSKQQNRSFKWIYRWLNKRFEINVEKC